MKALYQLICFFVGISLLNSCNTGRYYANKRIKHACETEEIANKNAPETYMVSKETAEKPVVQVENIPVTSDVGPGLTNTPKTNQFHDEILMEEPVAAKENIIQKNVPVKQLINQHATMEMKSDGGAGKGLYVILVGLLMLLLGWVLYALTGGNAFGLLFAYIFGIAAGILVLYGLILIILAIA
ncbi:MAG TPA: hypothetical protein VD905_01990 [Flavobacteriales bacterium]|nr:hypothetical protein [Flavobacteriales bacterium]